MNEESKQKLIALLWDFVKDYRTLKADSVAADALYISKFITWIGRRVERPAFLSDAGIFQADQIAYVRNGEFKRKLYDEEIKQLAEYVLYLESEIGITKSQKPYEQGECL